MKKIIGFAFLFVSITASAQNWADLKCAFTLIPDSAKVWVTDSVHLTAFGECKIENTTWVTVYGYGWYLGSSTKPPLWTVNGIPNGNTEVGQIFMHNGYHITYKAPSGYKPDRNPVEVIATYKDFNINGKVEPEFKITGHIEILGGWEAILDPDSAWLRVNDSLPLTFAAEYTSISPWQRSTIERGTGWWLDDYITPNPPEWTVNGIPNGNNLVGQIIRNGPRGITFKAPVHMPVKNPVEVIAAYKDIHFFGKKPYAKKLTALIWIVDSVNNSDDTDSIAIRKVNDGNNVTKETFEINAETSMKGGSNASWGGVVTYNDAGSFRVLVEGEKAIVTDIKNNLEVLTNNCAKIITNPTTCTGILHVAGIKSILVTPAKLPGQPYPIVEIWFVPFPTELTQYKFTCPPPPSARGSSIGKLDMSYLTMQMMARMPALPTYLRFIAKDGEQILIEKGTPGGELYYKFSVRKIRNE